MIRCHSELGVQLVTQGITILLILPAWWVFLM